MSQKLGDDLFFKNNIIQIGSNSAYSRVITDIKCQIPDTKALAQHPYEATPYSNFPHQTFLTMSGRPPNGQKVLLRLSQWEVQYSACTATSCSPRKFGVHYLRCLLLLMTCTFGQTAVIHRVALNHMLCLMPKKSCMGTKDQTEPAK